MDLKELQREWDALGASDPLGTTDPSARVGRWNPDEFFASGEREISVAMEKLRELGVSFYSGIALDFGCGAGRLTQALARRFQSVYGVDIAPSLIEQAKRLSRSEKCHYLINGRDDLRIFPPEFFDFVYTSTALQYMEPHYSTKYIGEFLRILRPGGVLVFDLPERVKPRPHASRLDTGAYRAQIRIVSAPEEASPGESFEIRAAVRNLSHTRWPGKHRAADGYYIRLGNHWLKASGETEMLDDGRTTLPHDLDPGAEVELNLKVVAPPRPGSYVLELDLVHEYALWFSYEGS